MLDVWQQDESLVNKCCNSACFPPNTVPVKQFRSDGIQDEILTEGSKFSLYCFKAKVRELSDRIPESIAYDMYNRYDDYERRNCN